MSFAGLDPTQFKEFKADTLKESLLTTMTKIDLLNDRGKIQLIPFGLIFISSAVSSLKASSSIEIKLPEIFTVLVAVNSTPRAVTDMIVNLPIVDHGPFPLIFGTSITSELRS